ncbi:MAG: DMT family transporter [Chloroflexota bacterium]
MEFGLVLASLSSVFFGASAAFVRRGVSRAGESFSGAIITLPVGLLVFSLIMAFTQEWSRVWSLSWQGLLLFSGAGVVHFILGRLLNYSSIRLIGANRATALAMTNMLYTLLFGIVLFHESVTWLPALGIVGIASGVTLVSLERREAISEKPIKAPGARVKGILLGLGAGVFWAASGLMIKPVLPEIGSPVAGAFISYLAATIAVAPLLVSRRQREQVTQLPRRCFVPLAIAGIFTALAHALRYASFSLSPISLAQPLVSTYILFVLIFSFFLNRKIEVFSRKVVAGIVLVVIGALLMSR